MAEADIPAHEPLGKDAVPAHTPSYEEQLATVESLMTCYDTPLTQAPGYVRDLLKTIIALRGREIPNKGNRIASLMIVLRGITETILAMERRGYLTTTADLNAWFQDAKRVLADDERFFTVTEPECRTLNGIAALMTAERLLESGAGGFFWDHCSNGLAAQFDP